MKQIETKKIKYQQKAFLYHVVNSNGNMFCSSKNKMNIKRSLDIFGKPLSIFIAKYNDADTKHTCCENCRDYIKSRQIEYKNQNNNSLVGFKL